MRVKHSTLPAVIFLAAISPTLISQMNCDTDSDGDGWTLPSDCDDKDPSVNPGAIEDCNGVDDDCSGQIDEPFDGDGDGFSICSGDCNDDNPDVGADSGCGLLVSDHFRITSYSFAGSSLETTEVPIMGGSTEYARDVISRGESQWLVYNGTGEPYLSTFHTDSGQWTHISYPDWSTANNLSYGGIALSGNRVFVTDMSVASEDESKSGLIYFDLESGESGRILSGEDLIDVTLGLDGLVYGLDRTGRRVLVIDPDSMELDSEIRIDFDIRAVSANSEGDLYGVSWDGFIYHLTRQGAIVNQLQGLVRNLTDIDLRADGLIAVGTTYGEVILTDQHFRFQTNFIQVSEDDTFVGFFNASDDFEGI